MTQQLLDITTEADQFPNLIVNTVNGSIQSVILPALAEHQDNKQRVKEMMRKAMTLSSYLVFPLMIGMAACAEPMIEVLLTEKWLPCVLYLRLLCFSYMLWPIHTANLQAINAIGHSEIFLKLEIIKENYWNSCFSDKYTFWCDYNGFNESDYWYYKHVYQCLAK